MHGSTFFFVTDAGVCGMTIKLTDNGEQDRDSLAEEYEQRLQDISR